MTRERRDRLPRGFWYWGVPVQLAIIAWAVWYLASHS